MNKKKANKLGINQALHPLSLRQLTKIGMTFWLGGSWTIGVIVIPILFKMLDQITAATISGQVLKVSAYTGIVALLFAIMECFSIYQLNFIKARKLWWAISALLLLLINNFAIFPLIVVLRTKLADMAHHVLQTTPSFNFWHSLSAILFVIINILGILYTLEK